MSALGQKQTSRRVRLMSALPPKADIADRDRYVRFVPEADLCTAAKVSPLLFRFQNWPRGRGVGSICRVSDCRTNIAFVFSNAACQAVGGAERRATGCSSTKAAEKRG
jgi:hypothetical protein